jgi:hypothetical protein
MTDGSHHATTSRSSHHAFHALIMVGIISALGVFFALTLHHNQSISELENRRLASWPTLSSEALLDGSYTRAIEKYVADHFPARAWLTEAAFAIRSYRGVPTGDRVIQVKGAETGFEDISKWASADENAPSDVPAHSHDDHESSVSDAPSQPTDAERVATSTITTVEQPVQTDVSNAATDKDTAADFASTGGEKDEAQIPAPVEVASVDPAVKVPEESPKPIVIQQPEPSSVQEAISVDVSSVIIKPDAPPAPAPAPVPAAPAAATPAVIPPTITPITPLPAKPHASKPTPPVESAQAKPLNVVGGVLLHEGQALFMFQGTDRGAQGYANAVNTWVELVAKKRPGMTSTVVVTPTSSHFYLPPAARARTTSEPKNLAAMRAALLPEVRFADVVSEMEGHQDEALFFKSDHHWTGLGAYYAYRAWAHANGVKPLELSAFSKRSVPGVAGSFWSLTQAPELRNADKESFYYVPTTVTFDGTQYTGPQQKTPLAQPFFAEKSRGYIVFLGGDIPLLVSNTSAGTGRTALVVKNSYGNAFAPYLLPHFDRVVVLDYRYVSRNIQDIVDTFGVTDLVFVNATITANSGAHQERMRQVARGSSTAWLTEAEKRRIKQQEDAAASTPPSATVSGTTQ